jgi:hypothetical protein
VVSTSGILQLSGSVVEHLEGAQDYFDHPTGQITLTGSLTDYHNRWDNLGGERWPADTDSRWQQDTGERWDHDSDSRWGQDATTDRWETDLVP